MSHTILMIFGAISVPFICIYLSYTLLLMELPDFKRKIKQPLSTRLVRILNYSEFIFVFLLPCLNEEKVILKTIQAILSLNYKNMVVIAIDDASDDSTAEFVQSVSDPRVRLYQRKLPDARKGKGEALNSCYRRITRAVTWLHINPDTVIISVIDGDGHPSTNLLLDAVEAFADPEVGAAQSRIRITNRDRLLPLMQDIEFAATVGAMQNARAYFGCVGLGGNGQFARLSTLRTLGEKPWTACLLEDFDLGIRILIRGWKILFLGDSHVAQQGLVSIRRFIRQRTRWVQGNIQCLYYIKDVSHSSLPLSAKLDLYYFLSQPWMNGLGSLLQLAACIVMFITFTSPEIQSVFSGANILFTILRLTIWFSLVLGPGFIWTLIYNHTYLKGERKKLILCGLFFPIYNLLMVPSVWIAFLRHMVHQNGWVKTERLTEKESPQNSLPADIAYTPFEPDDQVSNYS